MNKQTFFSAIVLILASLQAFAATTVCKNGSDERKVEVTSDTAPCEVKYFKASDTEGKVLYNAQNDAAYCTTKAKEFTEKLATLGFNCDGSETVTTSKAESTTTTTETKSETKAAEPAQK